MPPESCDHPNVYAGLVKRRGGIRALTYLYLSVTYRIHIAKVAKLATDATNHCTLLHAGRQCFGMYSPPSRLGHQQTKSELNTLVPPQAHYDAYIYDGYI